MLCLLPILWAEIGETVQSQKFTIGSQSPPSFKAPSPNVPAAHILPLTGKAGVPQSAGYLQSLRYGNHINGVYGLTSVTNIAPSDIFSTNIIFGAQSFQVEIDTGSSDTWVVGRDFQCIDQTAEAQEPESGCMFGPSYTLSHSFRRIPDQHFIIVYGDGSNATGIVGNETVTLAGIRVTNQEVAVVDNVTVTGDRVTSGLLGLSFRNSTSVYAGTNPNTMDRQIQYDPVFTTMYTRGYVLPLFSLAIERSSATNGTAPGGLLAIGGLPPVPFRPFFASAPFQLLNVNNAAVPAADSQKADPDLAYTFYAITIQGLTYERSNETKWSHSKFSSPLEPPSDASHIQVVIDSGTNLIYLPTGIAVAVNALFDPPAQFYTSYGGFAVNCSAKAPNFRVDIGGQTFFIDKKDLILDLGRGTGLCVTGVNDAGYGTPILETPFLKNVLAIFDVGAGEMRFAAREFY